MTDFYTIPKHLPPRTAPTYDQRIPKIIWQTMKTDSVPKIMKDYSDSWIEKNSEYEYRFFDDQDIDRFIDKEFPEYISGYKKIIHGAVKADLWRYLIVYKYGGVYADMDCRCIVSLRNWIEPAAKWVTQLGINKDVCQWLIITIPGNPVFKKAAEISLRNLLTHKKYAEYKGFMLAGNQNLELLEKVQPVRSSHPVMTIAGPPILQEAAEECLRTPSDADIFRSIQIVCVSGSVSCQMSGNVQHDYLNPEYLKGLEELSTPHYQSSLRQTGETFWDFVARGRFRLMAKLQRIARVVRNFRAKKLGK